MCLPACCPCCPSIYPTLQEGRTAKADHAERPRVCARFSLVFVILGAFAGTFGHFLRKYTLQINLVAGAIIVLFGLNFLGILRIPFINKTSGFGHKPKSGFLLLGIIRNHLLYKLVPCVGAFLGSALMLAATSQNAVKGVIMLLSFSLGWVYPLSYLPGCLTV